MIDVYALTSPNVQKVYVMLEECGLPYKEHFVDVWKGDQYKPEFSKVNPNNKIPVIVDHDGPGGKPYTVIESGATTAPKFSRLYFNHGTGLQLAQPALIQTITPRGMATGDVDGDGIADLVICMNHASTLPNRGTAVPGELHVFKGPFASGQV